MDTGGYLHKLSMCNTLDTLQYCSLQSIQYCNTGTLAVSEKRIHVHGYKCQMSKC